MSSILIDNNDLILRATYCILHAYIKPNYSLHAITEILQTCQIEINFLLVYHI